MSISSITEESIMEDILLRLDLKSVSLCNCVCKPWFTLIHTPNFIYKHLNLSIKHNNNNPRIIFQKWVNEIDIFNTSIDWNSLKSSETYVCDEQPVAAIEYCPIRDPAVKIMGSCDGLICLCTFNDHDRDEEATIWNPITREYKKLLPKRKNPMCYPSFYEIGYDYINDDYKVIRVTDSYYAGKTDIEVYSLKSNSWKCIKALDRFRFNLRGRRGVIVNGALHLIGNYGSSGQMIVISFDISNETIKELPLVEALLMRPQGNIAEEGYSTGNVGVLGGCLCLLCVKRNGGRADVWVMQEYGVKDSWIKRFTITQVDIITSSFINLMWDFGDGTILLSAGNNLLYYYYYDSNRDIVRKLSISGDEELKKATTFVPSLISPNSGTFRTNKDELKEIVGKRKFHELSWTHG